MAYLDTRTINGHLTLAGFGVPNRRRRVFLLASWHGDARDVLLPEVRSIWRSRLQAQAWGLPKLPCCHDCCEAQLARGGYTMVLMQMI